jgi:hypothetical protein
MDVIFWPSNVFLAILNIVNSLPLATIDFFMRAPLPSQCEF